MHCSYHSISTIGLKAGKELEYISSNPRIGAVYTRNNLEKAQLSLAQAGYTGVPLAWCFTDAATTGILATKAYAEQKKKWDKWLVRLKTQREMK